MIDLNKIKAIAFDFGGTLDIPGIHWFDFLWKQFGGMFGDDSIITKDQYWEAYVFGERQMEKHGIPRDTSFLDTIKRKLNYQFDYISTGGYLEATDTNRQDFIRIFIHGIPEIEGNLRTAARLIQALSKTYDLSIVSNYYGNLQAVLSEAGIFPYLNRLLDSTIVGVRKPDPAIWKMAIDQSGYKAEEFLIVGDSMKNDIRPAQSLGCPTVLVAVKGLPDDYSGAWVDSLGALATLLGELKQWG